MKPFKEFIEEIKQPTGKLKNVCWKGYTKIVPNCVPIK